MHGPQFLQEDASLWPMQPIESHELPPEFLPAAKQNLFTGITKVVSLSQTVDQLIESCSTLGKLKRLVGWLLRFREVVHNRSKNFEAKTYSERLTVSELQNAEDQVIKYVQACQFFELLSSSLSGEGFKTHRCPSVNGILRVRGRLSNATVKFNIKHSIILPRESHFTELIIRHHHQLVGHAGTGT